MKMSRMHLFRIVLAAALAGCAVHSLAQQALEIIPLRHRTVDQVLPALQPLVEPGGALTGQSGQLIVRASPANLAEIKRALEAIDRPLRRLQISVRFDDSLEAASQGIEAGGRRSEEHTSELQSHSDLVCRLLLEKKKNTDT